MKKCFVFFLLLMSASVFAENVEIVKDENLESYRVIQTNYLPYAKRPTLSLNFSMKYLKFASAPTPTYSLVVSLMISVEGQVHTIAEGSKMYVKLEDGTILEGSTIGEVNRFQNSEAVWSDSFGDYLYYGYPEYVFSADDIAKMATSRVVKLRVQVPWGKDGYFDKPDTKYFKEKTFVFNESLRSMKAAIDQRVNNAQSQNDILKGF